MTVEEKRLEGSRERREHWKRWGPYVSERAWGTVREDYSARGTAWEYFPHDHARSRAYRWNEDGIAGICDRHQKICIALALWNGLDPYLKERLFGVTNHEGNHGEDVKENYYYLDSTPTHSYMRYLYKYPQAAFPYEHLVAENGRRDRYAREYDLIDTGIFDEGRYFDVEVEYAKADVEDIAMRITVHNRGPEPATIHVLPHVWFRNTWSWGRSDDPKPWMRAAGAASIEMQEPQYGKRWMNFEGTPELLFTENETNARRLFGVANASRYVKDGIHEAVVGGRTHAVNPDLSGTKAAAHYTFTIGAGDSIIVRARFSAARQPADVDTIFAQRIAEADEFYAQVIPQDLSEDARNVMRQAFGGLMWTKQFYHYVVKDWLEGDPTQPVPPRSRDHGRNAEWKHLFNADVISMPDKWEYPWYAAWDLAFHCVPIALIDPEFAKDQIMLMVREWYMHPNGQLPAYEWKLSDVNPPVHAWAAWRVYKIDQKRRGVGDRVFLQRIFHKLLLNFTWWVNRKDTEGRNVFQGGFLGLDNIGVFDRSAPLPGGGRIEQSDSTGWMAMYSLNLLAIAMELASEDPAYEDVASKFWEHFLYIAKAISAEGLWDEEDGFFYDVLSTPQGHRIPMQLRSIVGLIPLFAVETMDEPEVQHLSGFKRRMDWFLQNRPDLTGTVASMECPKGGQRRLLSIVDQDKLRRILSVMLDENEFLSPYGIRSMSRVYKDRPYYLRFNGTEHWVAYEPAESTSAMFGGNSNWRGPVWFPVNFLLIEALQRYHHYYGDSFRVEFPTGSGNLLTLWEVAGEISRRLTHIFLRDGEGNRPVNGGYGLYREDPHWRNLVVFAEYFHGDDGSGVGAHHQTGWTGLVAKLMQQSGE